MHINEKLPLEYISKELVQTVSVIKKDVHLISELPAIASFLELGKKADRLDYRNGTPIAVPDYKLQNKAHRDYFKKLINSDGKVHILGLDLNIELPYKPMIRVGKVIFDKQGQSAANLLQQIKQESRNTFGDLYFVFNSGDWVRGTVSLGKASVL